MNEYWQLNFSDNRINEKQLVEETNALIRSSVIQHLRSDVPVGSFLSGGYDSSALVYYMSTSGYKGKTFSIGYKDWENSEHIFAKEVADKFGMENDFEIADENHFSLLDKMPLVYDEPLADISILPTYMVSRLARQKVKAVLSGEGADELFGGYTWQKLFFSQMNPSKISQRVKLLFENTDTVKYYANAMAMGWFDAHELKKMLSEDLHHNIQDDVHWFFRQHFDKKLSPLKSIQKMDIKCFMGEMVLTKVDRASMANSLEVRVPFLDHRLFEKIFSVREIAYFKPGITKFLLHENIKKHLPETILNRGKQGFVGPSEYYMNIVYYSQLLKKGSMVEKGVVNEKFIDQKISEKDYWSLWKLAVMEKWFSHWMN